MLLLQEVASVVAEAEALSHKPKLDKSYIKHYNTIRGKYEKIVISLARRQDRRKEFKNNNLKDYIFLDAIDYKTLDNKDYLVDEDFRDPLKIEEF